MLNRQSKGVVKVFELQCAKIKKKKQFAITKLSECKIDGNVVLNNK